MAHKPLRFHWSLSAAGERWKGAKRRAEQNGVPDVTAHLAFCHHAEVCEIDSLLTAFGFHRPDPLILAAALGMATQKIRFMAAVRSGVASPTAFVQQINTLSALTNGRICINVVGGHTPQEQAAYGDFLPHDARYARTDEFLTVCRRFWEGAGDVDFHGQHYHIEQARLATPFVAPDRTSPEIYVGGASAAAVELAARHADCFWTLPETPENLAARIEPLRGTRTEAGLLVSLLARETRAQAVREAYAMLAAIGEPARATHRDFAGHSDSVAFKSVLARAEQNPGDWLGRCLWTGAVPYLGAPAIAFVGAYDEVAEAILEYRQAGISQFLFMGWPDLDEMTRFHQGILPRVRDQERREAICRDPFGIPGAGAVDQGRK